MTRRILIILIVTIITVPLAINTLLYYLDPLGIVTYAHDLNALFYVSEPDTTGIRFLTGRYTFRGYTATIGHDGLRIVPDTTFAHCTIAAVGDSVAFGMGVEDYETFTNIFAQTFKDVHWINAGIPGYSALNVVQQINNIPADGYLWLIINNDDEPFRRYFGGQVNAPPAAIAQYVGWRQETPIPINAERFDDGARHILNRENVLAFAFADVSLTEHIEQAYPQVVIIPLYTEVVSRADPHPNAVGHQQIADAMMPYVSTFVEDTCV